MNGQPGLRVKISAALGALKPVYRSPAVANAAAATAAAAASNKNNLGDGARQTIRQEEADSGWTAELWVLLWSAAASEEHRARLCAIDWAIDLFPFCHVGARRLCVALSGTGDGGRVLREEEAWGF